MQSIKWLERTPGYSSDTESLEITPIPTTRKKMSKLEMDGFSYIHQRNEVTGQTANLKIGQTNEHGESQLRSACWEQKLLEPVTDRNT